MPVQYFNWDNKPRVFKAYQSGLELVIVGERLNIGSDNISSLILFFEYYRYYGNGDYISGYMLGKTSNDTLNPTREVVLTITNPHVTLNSTNTEMRIILNTDISNFVKTFDDTYNWVGGGTKHLLLHAKLTWGFGNNNSSFYSVVFNCWREIDTPHSWNTHIIKRNSRITYGVFDKPLYDYNDVIYINHNTSNYKSIICDVTRNDGSVNRHYIYKNDELLGNSGQLGFGYTSAVDINDVSIIQSRFYIAIAKTSSSEWIMGLDSSVPTYILCSEGVESALNSVLPEVNNIYYDRIISKYVIEGNHLDARPLVLFGWSRENSSNSQIMRTFSHPIIDIISEHRIEISMGVNDVNSGSSYSYYTTPLDNSLSNVAICFLHDDYKKDSMFFVFNSIDGVLSNSEISFRNTNVISPNFGLIDIDVMKKSISYNPSTWGDGSSHRLIIYINPLVSKPYYVSIQSVESAQTVIYYSFDTSVYSYSIENIGGVDFGRVDILIPLNSFDIENRVGRFLIRIGGVIGIYVLDVSPTIINRVISFDTPYIILGDGGYYQINDNITRNERVVLLARAVDPVGVSEHPPDSPYNNTIRISETAGGWQGNVSVVATNDSDAIEIYPFTTYFLSGGENGSDYSYEVCKFEIELKSGYNFWSGRLHLYIQNNFVHNFIIYSGEGYSVPITLIRTAYHSVSLPASDNLCLHGSIDDFVGRRRINLRAYVPQYLKESPFEYFVGVFEDTMNNLYEGSSVNDPYVNSHGILDKIDGLLDLHNPDTIETRYLHLLAKNFGYDMVTGIMRARDIDNAPADLIKYARFLLSNLSEINRIKSTKDAIRAILFSVGAMGDIYYRWTRNYGLNYDSNFNLVPSPEYDWAQSNEQKLYSANTYIENRQIDDENMALTPHFNIDVDLFRFDLYSDSESIVDILVRVFNTINAIRPVNTVIDDISLVVNVDHVAKQYPSFVTRWGDSLHSQIDVYGVNNLDNIDEGSNLLSSPHDTTIDSMQGTLSTPLPDSVESPSGFIT